MISIFLDWYVFFFFGNLLILILELLISSLSLILKIKIYQACDKKDKEDRWNWWNRWLIDFCVYNSFDNIVLSAIRLIFIYRFIRYFIRCSEKFQFVSIKIHVLQFIRIFINLWSDLINLTYQKIILRIVYIYIF